MRRTRTVVRLCAALICLLLSLVAAGCARPQGTADYFAYAREGMEMTVRARITRTAADGYGGEVSRVGESYTGKTWEAVASVTVSPPDERGDRTASVTFSSPPALAGVTVSRACTENSAAVTVSRTLSDGQILRVTNAEGGFDGLLRLADVWLPRGDVVETSPVIDGVRTVTVSDPDGGRATYTFATDEKLPLRVVVGDSWGEIEVVRGVS